MGENLVIVESPAKAKTIEKFLGSKFLVKSSFGHIRDLAKKDFGIDIQNNYTPQYEISPDKKKIVAELKKLAKEADTVWLASDEDREGEAISWHLAEVLGLKDEKTKRIVFHEITKNAIQNAIKNPRKINYDLVDAQQARRVLDRLVGFEISPVLWKKIKPALSAGRVQSVAVRLLVEREREIIGFKSVSAFKITALFLVTDKKGKQVELKAELPEKFEKKQQAEAFLRDCMNADFTVNDVTTKPSKKSPAAPFTTSTLQQEASRKLNFSVAQTMTVAQKLYENGFITYMRTDSLNLSTEAINAIKDVVIEEHGEKYSNPRAYKTKTKGAQEAHEAIRPTYFDKKTVDGSIPEKRLYDLIWKRTVASQMADAQLEKTTVNISISGKKEEFIARGEVLKFEGFLKVYIESNDDEQQEDKSDILPPLKVGDKLNMSNITATERFTQSPPRYTEASLVKKLEELGIGRPSTYAPTISTVQKRGYVLKESRDGEKRNYVQLLLQNKAISEKKLTEITGAEKNKLFPTDIGMVVTDFLVDHFKDVFSYNFTANVEKEFDEIAAGTIVWSKMIDKFYKPFHSLVVNTLETSERNTGQRILGVDKESGKQISVRIGRFGPMVQLGEGTEEDKPQFASLRKGQHIETITLEEALDVLKNRSDGRILGKHPESGKQISVREGRYGPMVQLGSSEDTEKPQYASLKTGQTIDSISFEEALELFKLPRTLGEFENKEVVVAIGRFGPYVRHNSKFTSLKKTDDPYTITLQRAIELIDEKRSKDEDNIIKDFGDKHPRVMKDRWGKPCVFFKRKYYRIPKDIEAENLTLEDCMKLINLEAGETEETVTKTNSKTKTAAKTSTAKPKTTTKRTTKKA